MLIVVAFSTFTAFAAFPALGMGIAVAGHAIVDVSNALFKVLADQRRFLMLVAIKASVFAEIARRCVATGAANVVRSGKCEELCVVNICRCPVDLCVAGAALRRHARMNRRRGGRMAVGTRRPRLGGQHCMGKGMAVLGRQAGHGVIGVASQAIRIRQPLMKGRHWYGVNNRRPGNRALTNIRHSVAGCAARLDRALQGCMAGKTIVCQFCMRRDQRPGGKHRIRIDKNQRDDAHKIGGDKRQEPAFHDHPQKITALMIWAMPKTAKARVIG